MPTRKKTGTAGRKRRARGSITPEEVIRGALAICEKESLDALSMPRLAQELGLGVTSIYWYFKSKEELLDALTEIAFSRLYEQLVLPVERGWEDLLRGFFTDFRRIMRAEPVLCDLIVMRNGNYTEQSMLLTWTRIEEILEQLVGAGFSEDSATYAYFTLSVYTRGCLFQERIARNRGIDPITYRHRTDVVAELPVLSRELRVHSWSMVADEDFEFGLENNIRGLRALLEKESAVG